MMKHHFLFSALMVLLCLPAFSQYQIDYWENGKKKQEGKLVNGEPDSVYEA